MLKKNLGNLLIKNNIIETTQLQLFNYGITVAGLLMANLLTAILISIFLDTVPYCILFIILLFPIRRYSGGFHAGHPIICYLESQILILTAQLFVIHLPHISYKYEIIMIFISLICAAFIFLKSPVYSLYKPLNPKQEKAYGRLAKYLSVIYVLLEIIFYAANYNKLFLLVFTVLLIQGILLLIPEREHHPKR